VFPISTKNSTGSKPKTSNFVINNQKVAEKHITQYQQQAINLIPLYKNISAGGTIKKKLLYENTPENKTYNDHHKTHGNSQFNTPLNHNKNSDYIAAGCLLLNNRTHSTNSNEAEKYNKTLSSNEKKNCLRIPLQSIKNNSYLARNKIFSAKINENKTKNKFSLNSEAVNEECFNSNNSNNQVNLSLEKNEKNKSVNIKKFKANLEKVRISKKAFGCVEGYAAITTEGLVRGYNEDRVSIILNIPQTQNFKGDKWPKCSFFGIYDGHGGSACADFLRDNLHKFV